MGPQRSVDLRLTALDRKYPYYQALTLEYKDRYIFDSGVWTVDFVDVCVMNRVTTETNKNGAMTLLSMNVRGLKQATIVWIVCYIT